MAKHIVLFSDGTCRAGPCWLSGAIQIAMLLLPGFMAPWINAFSARPDVFRWLALPAVAGLRLGAGLDARIHDSMRRI